MNSVEIPIPPVKPQKRGPIKMLQAEVDANFHTAFRDECRRQKTTMQSVIEYYARHWMTQVTQKRGKRAG